jgi:hypothetical protein
MVTATETVALRITSSHREKASKAEKAVVLGLGSDDSGGATSVGIIAPARNQTVILRLRVSPRQHVTAHV